MNSSANCLDSNSSAASVNAARELAGCDTGGVSFVINRQVETKPQ